ncbi:hypothetical protein ACFLT2_02220 [Acidobacteriota bacterium]
MTQVQLRKILVLSLFFIGMSAFVFFLPMTSYGAGGENAQYFIGIDVSPNIINIESERLGEIRILTNMRYSFYAANGDSIFIYFNVGEDSVENVRATRDSLGNLILKFSLEDLMAIESSLNPNDTNKVIAVVVMENGDEYTGEDEVYLSKKRN